MAHPSSLLFLVFLLTQILDPNHNPIQMTHAKSDGFTLELIYRDSPESPLYQTNITYQAKMKELIEKTRNRAQWFTNMIHITNNNNSSLNSSINFNNNAIIRPTLTFDPRSSLFLVKVGIGTFNRNPPFHQVYLALDTASDLTWTQCQGCTNCFGQSYPLFPAQQSRSFDYIPCDHCPSGTECVQNSCKVERSYIDGAIVRAIVGTETFTLEGAGTYTRVEDVGFGCGMNMQNFHVGHEASNKISGYMGMNYRPLSFVNQADSYTQKRFSYCFQTTVAGSRSSSPMHLRFGSDVVSDRAMMSTPMPRTNQGWYYLNLEGISVGIYPPLNIPPGSFRPRTDGTGGVIIDSGAVFSLLMPPAYGVLANAITDLIVRTNRNMRKMDIAEQGYELCFEQVYEVAGAPMNLPGVVLHFANGAKFRISSSELYYQGRSSSGKNMVCMTILEGTPRHGGVTLIGAIHQVNKRIVYDLRNQRLLFKDEDCSRNN